MGIVVAAWLRSTWLQSKKQLPKAALLSPIFEGEPNNAGAGATPTQSEVFLFHKTLRMLRKKEQKMTYADICYFFVA
jgi:hypothetical protein